MPSIEDQSEDDIKQFLILYLQSRHAQKWGYCSYKVYAATIGYATGVKDKADLRSLWSTCLLNSGYFEKRKVGSITEYRFSYEV